MDPATAALKLSDGTLSPAEGAEITRLLEQDPVFRKEVARHMIDVTLLHQALEPATALPVPGHKPRNILSFTALTAMAAILIGILTATILIFRNQSSHRTEITWELVDSKDAIASAGTSLPDPASPLQRVSLASGTLTLQLPSGPVVALTGPIDATFLDAMHMKLDHGRITVDVGERGKGFTVTTRHGKVVDLGTRFGVNSAQQSDQVVVFDGEIELSPKSSPRRITKFTEGQAVTLANDGELLDNSSVITGSSESDWEFGPSSDPKAVITHVTDNNRNRWSFNFYPLKLGGMQEGAYAWPYEINKPCWWPSGAKLSADLNGADLVQILQQELNNKDLEISVTLGRPARVFVFHQAQGPFPEWLEKDFKRTGETLILSPSDPRGPKLAPFRPLFEVWSRDVPEAGTITLGAVNKTDVNSSPFYLYGIAAKALDSN